MSSVIYCAHVYKRVNAVTCPYCGCPTSEFNWEANNKLHFKWIEENPDHEYEYWSI